MNKAALKYRIRLVRHAREMTMKSCGAAMEMSANSVCKLEDVKHSCDFDVMKKFAIATNFSITDLCGPEENFLAALCHVVRVQIAITDKLP